MSDSEGNTRRRFTAEYKQAVLERLEGCSERGERTQLLQDEGLLWSHVAKWRRQSEAGMLEDSWTELSSRQRLELLLQEREALLDEIEQLRRENDGLRRDVGDALTPPGFTERLGRVLRRRRPEGEKDQDEA